jgi:ABC-type antimicrobial peptide transport system permease subunit
LYLPHSAANPEVLDMQMLVQFEGNLKTFTAVLREQIQRIDPALLASVGPLTQELAGGFRLFRGLTGLAQLLGLVALTLAAMGLYGVMAYAVSQRTREIGIRMALGAEKQNVFGWVLGKGARLILFGLALGVPGGVMLSSYLAALLVGLSPTDPITFVGVAFFLGAVGLLACYIPARRATRVEPMVALRCE